MWYITDRPVRYLCVSDFLRFSADQIGKLCIRLKILMKPDDSLRGFFVIIHGISVGNRAACQDERRNPVLIFLLYGILFLWEGDKIIRIVVYVNFLFSFSAVSVKMDLKVFINMMKRSVMRVKLSG